MSYAAVHFGEANRELRDLREAGRGRTWLLVITLVFGALSLLGIAYVARGIVTRVRGYSTFTRQVASGDLTVRLQPQGRDELTGLAHSLNGMVEQLSTAESATPRDGTAGGRLPRGTGCLLRGAAGHRTRARSS